MLRSTKTPRSTEAPETQTNLPRPAKTHQDLPSTLESTPNSTLHNKPDSTPHTTPDIADSSTDISPYLYFQEGIEY